MRIYPDELAVENADTGVSDAEADAGRTYWTDRWTADAVGDKAATDVAWTVLIATTGKHRAPLVASALLPSNLDAKPVPGVPGDPAPAFAATGPRRIRRTVIRSLPDRFVILAEQGNGPGRTVSRATGRPVPEELPAGIFEGEAIDPGVAGLLAGESRWLVDYEAAQGVGLGIDVVLEQPGVTVGRLLAYGVRTTLDPETAASRLADLVASHRRAGRAAVLSAGVATNNTEAAPSAHDSTVPPLPPPAGTAANGSGAGAELERALGLPAGTLHGLPGADEGWEAPAGAMAAVLWPATWEAYLAHRLGVTAAGVDPVLSFEAREALRRHATSTVRGLGPLPLLRLGKQPYGVLPVTSTSATYSGDGSFAESSLVPFLERIRPLWRGAAGALPTVADADLETALPRILGTLPTSNGLRVRSVVSRDPGIASVAAAIAGSQTSGQTLADEIVTRLIDVEPSRLDPGGLLSSHTRVLGLPLTSDDDPDVLGRLAAGAPTDTPTSVLQALATLSAAELDGHRQRLVDNPEQALELLPQEAVHELDLPWEDLRPALVRVVEQSDDPGETGKLAALVARAVGPFDADLHAARFPVAALRPAAAAAVPILADSRARLVAQLQVLGAVFALRSREHDFRAGLEVLSDPRLTSSQRAMLLTGTLDTTSHRLDAWLTALATRRLRELRRSRPTGTLLGAYGWAENLVIAPPPDVPVGTVLPDPADLPGGFVHAPGLTSASTAAVLRNGRLSAMRRGSAAFDLDLSSTRVRSARGLLEGAGRGQSIGALLGYRFERHLLTHGAERWVYPIRALAPIRTGKLTDAGAPSESVAAGEVVDGAQLVQLDPAALLAKANAWRPSAGDTYLDPNAWEPMTPGERTAIGGAHLLIADLRDAAADLLLAESVHALVEGAPARAAAVTDAAAAGEAVPPELRLLRSDRSGVAVTHRLLVLLGPGTALAGYSPTRPRASAEPRLERWLQAQLGPAPLIVLRERPNGTVVTLDAAKICALELVLGSASGGVGAPGLDADTPLTATLRRAAGGPLLARRPAGWARSDPRLAIGEIWELSRVLAGVLASARPVDAGDLGRPDGSGSSGRATELVALRDRVHRAQEGLQKAHDTLAALLPAVDDAVAPAPATVASLRTRLERLADYGVGPGWLEPPADNQGDSHAGDAAVLTAARASLATAKARLASAEAAITTATQAQATGDVATATGALRAAAADLLGNGFLLLPVLAKGTPAGTTHDVFSAALAAPVLSPVQVATRLRPWLLRVAAVRPAVARWTTTVRYREALGRPVNLRVAQTPAGATSAWVGATLTPKQVPQVPVADVVIDAPEGSASLAHAQLSGFVVDTWVDTLPRRRVLSSAAGGDAPAVPEPVTTTGIAVNANAPNNEAPQAILLALSPDRQRWDDDRLVAVLHDTIDLVRLRGVTLETLPWAGRVLPAAYVRDWSLQGEPTLDSRLFRDAASALATPLFVRGN